ncbi:MAG: CoA-binding protein [Bacteriovoracaceae bacterium]|nr:CoA-binding protein [Bacteriovoracaceae bacterium]
MGPVVVLGASSDPTRYSHMAVQNLLDKGFKVIAVHPREKEVLGLKVYPSLAEIPAGAVDTVTMYISSILSEKISDAIVHLKPKRVIFNPGSENPKLSKKLQEAGVEVLEACTLVMLRTNQF